MKVLIIHTLLVVSVIFFNSIQLSSQSNAGTGSSNQVGRRSSQVRRPSNPRHRLFETKGLLSIPEEESLESIEGASSSNQAGRPSKQVRIPSNPWRSLSKASGLLRVLYGTEINYGGAKIAVIVNGVIEPCTLNLQIIFLKEKTQEYILVTDEHWLIVIARWARHTGYFEWAKNNSANSLVSLRAERVQARMAIELEHQQSIFEFKRRNIDINLRYDSEACQSAQEAIQQRYLEERRKNIETNLRRDTAAQDRAVVDAQQRQELETRRATQNRADHSAAQEVTDQFNGLRIRTQGTSTRHRSQDQDAPRTRGGTPRPMNLLQTVRSLMRTPRARRDRN